MIDIDQVDIGDHVELEWTSPQGETAKVSGTVWKWGGYQPMVGPFALTGDQYKIIAHTRATPEWAGALVVRDKDGEYWGLVGDRYVCLADDPVTGNQVDAGHLPSAMRQYGPFTVIIDAEGCDLEADFLRKQLQRRHGPCLNADCEQTVEHPHGSWCTATCGVCHPDDQAGIKLPEEFAEHFGIGRNYRVVPKHSQRKQTQPLYQIRFTARMSRTAKDIIRILREGHEAI